MSRSRRLRQRRHNRRANWYTDGSYNGSCNRNIASGRFLRPAVATELSGHCYPLMEYPSQERQSKLILLGISSLLGSLVKKAEAFACSLAVDAILLRFSLCIDLLIDCYCHWCCLRVVNGGFSPRTSRLLVDYGHTYSQQPI